MKVKRQVKFEDGRMIISDDPQDVLRVFITGAIADMLALSSQEMKEFLRRFQPNGKGYTVYDTASAYIIDIETGEHVREGDNWDIVMDSPFASITVGGDELRFLLRQVIMGKLPYHPELVYAYDD